MKLGDWSSTWHGDEMWVPPHQRVHATLRDRIVPEEFGVSSLPLTEAELCSEFKARRFIIGEAFCGLSEQGIVQRRQRVGTGANSPGPKAI